MKLKLLTIGNPKTMKGQGAGYLTAILHLAPATISGVNVCRYSSAGCRASCLYHEGRAGIPNRARVHVGTRSFPNTIQAARYRRTRLWVEDPQTFLAYLHADLDALVRVARRQGLTPCVRLNGTSDILWERVPGLRIPAGIVRYDYTKYPLSVRPDIPGYHLTSSWHEGMTPDDARAILATGRNVAVPFDVRRGRPLPATWQGMRVVDGDVSDLRFLDPRGVIVGLRIKGRKVNRERALRSGFAVRLTPAERAA